MFTTTISTYKACMGVLGGSDLPLEGSTEELTQSQISRDFPAATSAQSHYSVLSKHFRIR